MRTNLQPASVRAIKPNGKFAAEITTDGISAVDDSNWFSDVARVLLPTKAGTALHCITGYDERLCQRYAAGHVKPPAFFLRTLLRSEQGGPFLNALMEGCSARWWLDYQRRLRNGSKVENAEFE